MYIFAVSSILFLFSYFNMCIVKTTRLSKLI